MAIRYDIQLDSNDIIVIDNDLKYGESDMQHIIDTINANPSWWKENYTEGVGILNFLKGQGIEQELARKTKINLQADNYNSVPLVAYDNLGKLILNPQVTI